jgi:flagellar basal-body rod protein FlgG
VLPGITVPSNASSVTINTQGQVLATVAGNVTPQTVGQLELTVFPNPAGLNSVGSNMFLETPASGTPQTGVPGSPGYGTIQQGYLETSNVNSVDEITALITAQRAYEMNSKVVTAADQMLQQTAQMGGA